MWPVPPPPSSWRPTPNGGIGATRPKDDRLHTGVDLPASIGVDVVAPASGEVVGVTGWDGDGQAVYLLTAVGTWILAPLEVAVEVGQQVAEGQRLGSLVRYPKGSVMLHLELWTEGAGRSKRPTWREGERQPEGLADPWTVLQGQEAPKRPTRRWPLVVAVLGGAWLVTCRCRSRRHT